METGVTAADLEIGVTDAGMDVVGNGLDPVDPMAPSSAADCSA